MNHDVQMHQSIRDVVLRELHREPQRIQKLKGGRNSQVFRVDCTDNSSLAVKFYFQSEHDRRDRMGCEVRALQFLKNSGVRDVASVLAIDQSRRIAIYDFIHGQPVAPNNITDSDITQAIDFLQTLKRIASATKPSQFPPASEACFSINEILESIDGRFRRLEQAATTQPALAHFLQHELAPRRIPAEQRAHALCRKYHIAPEAPVPHSERTLSPSDFGFHNALRIDTGKLVFLDFEYFGWDDPSKTVVDFLLHPAMQLSPARKQQFHAGMIAAFNDLPNLKPRVHVVYPLFALKWCAILLNEFTLEHMARRCFADGAQGAWNEDVQLDKARRMLAQVTDDDHNLPFHT